MKFYAIVFSFITLWVSVSSAKYKSFKYLRELSDRPHYAFSNLRQNAVDIVCESEASQREVDTLKAKASNKLQNLIQNHERWTENWFFPNTQILKSNNTEFAVSKGHENIEISVIDGCLESDQTCERVHNIFTVVYYTDRYWVDAGLFGYSTFPIMRYSMGLSSDCAFQYKN